MKIRSGFVSNSSSSSFIIASKLPIKTAEDLEKVLFGEKKLVTCFDYQFDSKLVAEYLFHGMKKLSPKKFKAELYNAKRNPYSRFTNAEGMDPNSEHVYKLGASDDSDLGAVAEHGDHWRYPHKEIKVYRESHH
jgi:hypothetical protein